MVVVVDREKELEEVSNSTASKTDQAHRVLITISSISYLVCNSKYTQTASIPNYIPPTFLSQLHEHCKMAEEGGIMGSLCGVYHYCRRYLLSSDSDTDHH